MMNNPTLVSVRVKPEIAQRLELLAEATKRSKSYLAAEALEEYLDIHEWQVQAIQEGIEAVNHNETESIQEVRKYWKQRLDDSTH
jgi:predicted transcriptional regulator